MNRSTFLIDHFPVFPFRNVRDSTRKRYAFGRKTFELILKRLDKVLGLLFISGDDNLKSFFKLTTLNKRNDRDKYEMKLPWFFHLIIDFTFSPCFKSKLLKTWKLQKLRYIELKTRTIREIIYIYVKCKNTRGWSYRSGIKTNEPRLPVPMPILR